MVCRAGKFSDIAGTFYRNAIQRTVVRLADWLRMQPEARLIELDDVDEAAGHAALWLPPRRGAPLSFGRVPLPSRSQIVSAGAQLCCDILHGCQAKRISGHSACLPQAFHAQRLCFLIQLSIDPGSARALRSLRSRSFPSARAVITRPPEVACAGAKCLSSAAWRHR